MLECPLRGHWVSFRLVDEHGEGTPYAGLPYVLHDSQGQQYPGALDGEGFARINNIYCGPAVLDISALDSGFADIWYQELAIRDAFKLPLTALQVMAEQSPSGPRGADGKTYLAEARATREQARFLRVEVSDFVEATKHLPERDLDWWPSPNAVLKQNAGSAAKQLGIALTPKMHHVLEVKALRAYSPLLSRDSKFCALNAYQLAVMTALVYAPFSTLPGKQYVSAPPPYLRAGSIGQVLREQLGHLIKPTRFDKANYHLLWEEVPYSKRLEVMPYDPERYSTEASAGWSNPEDVHFLHDDTDTQAFITHNDKIVLISLRGTQEWDDKVRDGDARQVPYREGSGQAHRGFYEAFQAAKEFVGRYLDAFHRPGQSIIVCGHSLGGAIALLLAEWLRNNWSANTQLYTYGAPRAGDRAFVESAQGLAHHRLVNHNDPVPGIPSAWMDVEWKMAVPGAVILFSAPPVGVTLLFSGLVNLKGDPYEHHGEQRHFMPRLYRAGSEAAILWQPGCAVVDQLVCGIFTGSVALEGDMPKRKSFIGQLFSAAEHSSDTGYSRSMLSTLLRWNASVEERNGELFSAEERKGLDGQIQHIEQQVTDWTTGSFEEFRREPRLRNDPRFKDKTDKELRTLYDDGMTQVSKLRIEQRGALAQARNRLLNQADRRLTREDVFGDLSQRKDLPELVAQWRALEENRKAEKLVLLSVGGIEMHA